MPPRVVGWYELYLVSCCWYRGENKGKFRHGWGFCFQKRRLIFQQNLANIIFKMDMAKLTMIAIPTCRCRWWNESVTCNCQGGLCCMGGRKCITPYSSQYLHSLALFSSSHSGSERGVRFFLKRWLTSWQGGDISIESSGVKCVE